MVTVKELQTVLKTNVQAQQNGAMNKSSLESMAQDDNFQEVKRCKRHISNDTLETAKMTTESIPVTTGVKQTPKAVPTRNFFAPLRADMNTQTTGAENNLMEQEAPRKSGRPPSIVVTSTIILIRLQSDLQKHVKGEYEF
jgi:hypothetical protein